MKGFITLSAEQLGDLIFFAITIFAFSYFVATYFAGEEVIGSREIAMLISSGLKQAVGGGENTKIILELPRRYCHVEISAERIYVSTQENPVTRILEKYVTGFLKQISSYIGLKLNMGPEEIPNPVGVYFEKDKTYTFECSEVIKKKLWIRFYREDGHERIEIKETE